MIYVSQITRCNSFAEEAMSLTMEISLGVRCRKMQMFGWQPAVPARAWHLEVCRRLLESDIAKAKERDKREHTTSESCNNKSV